MMKYQSFKELKAELGSDYTVKIIDLEKCLYNDFGNGFNVEISGCSDGRSKRGATLYLWFGDKKPGCMIVKTVRDIERTADAIDAAVDVLYDYSLDLIYRGYDNWHKLMELRHSD